MNTVILLRGAPGSGKSFTCKELVKNISEGEAVICSADHYFMDADGIYKFDRNLLGQAHSSCFKKFLKALEDKIPLVLVDNTNVKYSDLRDYVVYAAISDYTVKLVESNSPWARNPNECFKKNSHGVPLDSIQRMLNHYQSNETVARFALENLGINVEY